jgi:hypothetical protein
MQKKRAPALLGYMQPVLIYHPPPVEDRTTALQTIPPARRLILFTGAPMMRIASLARAAVVRLVDPCVTDDAVRILFRFGEQDLQCLRSHASIVIDCHYDCVVAQAVRGDHTDELGGWAKIVLWADHADTKKFVEPFRQRVVPVWQNSAEDV